MEFAKDDLLSFKKLESLISNPDETEQGKIISKYLRKYLVIIKDKLYVLQKNVTYKLVTDKINTILERTIKFISKSFNNLSEEDQEYLQLRYKKKQQWAKILKTATIKKLIPQIDAGLRNDNIKLDDYTNELHFSNRYIDLTNKEKALQQRVVNKHFITAYIDRDYKKPSKKAIAKLHTILCQIYPEEIERNAVLYKLMSSFTGLSRLDQELFFLLGKGSAGKSTIMKALKCSLTCYVMEFSSNTFTKGNPKQDKIINSFATAVYMLLAWINEPDFEKMDEKLFKKICEGILQVTKLYLDGLHEIPHKAKGIFTANNLPNIIPDTGVIRRIFAYEHKTEFVDDNSKYEIDNKKYFKKDKEIETSFETDVDLQNAVVDLVYDQCLKYNHKEKVVIPESFDRAKTLIVGSNDYMKDFIDAFFIVTNNDEDRISKLQMLKLYKELYPDRHANPLTLISALKDKDIRYESQYRVKGYEIKGAFVGIKIKDDDDDNDKNNKHNKVDDDDDDDDIDKEKLGINAPQPVVFRAEEVKQLMDEQKTIIELQKQELEQLKALLKAYEDMKDDKSEKSDKELRNRKHLKNKVVSMILLIIN
jgi:hypothetical protein